MSYNCYKFNFTSVTKVLREFGLSGKKDSLESQIKTMSRVMPDALTEITGAIIADELWHRENGTYIFPESPEVVNALSEIDISVSGELVIDQGSYVINFPSSGRNGDLVGALITVSPQGEEGMPILSNFDERYLDPSFKRDLIKSEPFISLNYPSPFDENFSKDYGGRSYSRICIPFSEAKSIVSMPPTEQSQQEIGNLKLGNFFESGISFEEYKYQIRLLRSCLAVLIYRQAKPELFESRVPLRQASTKYHRDSKVAWITAKASPALNGSREGTYVGFVMRNLRHEKYYKDPFWAGKPRGSRWTLVEPYVVGAKGKTETIISGD